MELPKISVVTPSYNQGKFLEQTIRSVFDQNYPNIEYVIIDGGSKDQSIDIIKKYQQKLAYWVSEPDDGQPDALNKGFSRCTGEIMAFINSDDYYEPGTFARVATEYQNGHEWIIGTVRNFREHTAEVEIVQQHCNAELTDWLIRKNQNHQPGNFWSRRIFNTVGYLRKDLHYAFDWEYWVRFVNSGYTPTVLNECIFASFRLHEESKTVKFWSKFNKEYIQVINEYKQLLSTKNQALVNSHVKDLLINEKVLFGRIESIDGNFRASYQNFIEAYRLSGKMIINPRFLFEFFKAMIYMPIRKKLS